MDVHAYLARIGYNCPLAPTADTLRALHRQHMLTVPFENLDISLGREIILDPERFVEKIVGQRAVEAFATSSTAPSRRFSRPLASV
jgi:N-hydroxyarylamine O-acetyltransferase